MVGDSNLKATTC